MSADLLTPPKANLQFTPREPPQPSAYAKFGIRAKTNFSAFCRILNFQDPINIKHLKANLFSYFSVFYSLTVIKESPDTITQIKSLLHLQKDYFQHMKANTHGVSYRISTDGNKKNRHHNHAG